jgi:hypothetical protein
MPSLGADPAYFTRTVPFDDLGRFGGELATADAGCGLASNTRTATAVDPAHHITADRRDPVTLLDEPMRAGLETHAMADSSGRTVGDPSASSLYGEDPPIRPTEVDSEAMRGSERLIHTRGSIATRHGQLTTAPR